MRSKQGKLCKLVKTADFGKTNNIKSYSVGTLKNERAFIDCENT